MFLDVGSTRVHTTLMEVYDRYSPQTFKSLMDYHQDLKWHKSSKKLCSIPNTYYFYFFYRLMDYRRIYYQIETKWMTNSALKFQLLTKKY